jgi:hypothetical protein
MQGLYVGRAGLGTEPGCMPSEWQQPTARLAVCQESCVSDTEPCMVLRVLLASYVVLTAQADTCITCDGCKLVVRVW